MKTIPVFLIVLFGLLGVAAQERFVTPVDDAKKDPSLVAFRAKLIAAANKRDDRYIVSILDPNVVSSFGGDEGIADFKRFWKFPDPKSEFWGEFLRAISNGGRFVENSRNMFCAPYLFDSFPDDLDSFRYFAIFGSRVNLRSRPSLKARVIAQLSYNIVEPYKIGDRINDGDWIEVRTLGGLRGFINSKFVRSPIDYRACFEKKGGKWRMTAFVAGD